MPQNVHIVHRPAICIWIWHLPTCGGVSSLTSSLYDASTEGEDSTRALTGTIMLGRMKNHTETIIRPTVVLWLWDQGGEEAKRMRLLTTNIVELYLPTKLNTNISHCSCKPTETDGFRQKHMRGCRRYDQWFNDDDGIAMIMIEFDQYQLVTFLFSGSLQPSAILKHAQFQPF